jgi:hypothetical protein
MLLQVQPQELSSSPQLMTEIKVVNPPMRRSCHSRLSCPISLIDNFDIDIRYRYGSEQK